MTRLRVLIVDDERICRLGIVRLLEADPTVEIAGEAANGLEAVEAITRLRPDLVLLDIQMPEMDGFEALRALRPEETPRVIFVTAYDQYALRAFEVNALDYLLKPFSDERFAASLARAKTETGRSLEALLRSSRAPERFVVRTGNKVRFLSVQDVDWIEAAQNYVCLHAGEESGLLRETMNSLEQILRPAGFVRIHRGLMVNARRIGEICSIGEGEYEIRAGKHLLKSSRHYRKQIAALLRGGRPA